MKAAGGERRLVGIASVAGIRGLPGAEAYSASKAAAITYLESLRLEMRPYGIKVVTIAPGYIATPMTAINPYKMPFLLPAEKAAKIFAASHRARHSLRRDSLADGPRRQNMLRAAAQLAIRPHCSRAPRASRAAC
jgi:NAD(P)-dependent dehydrogenase (short-subunit alcohol dehydrogenase family)